MLHNYLMLLRMKIIFETNKQAHFLSGYYDKQVLNPSNHCLVLNKVSSLEEAKNKKSEIVIVNILESTYEKITETKAWNFQQGSMCQWLDYKTIIYKSLQQCTY